MGERRPLTGFATYLTDKAASGPKRTATMKGHIDKAAEIFDEMVLFCNHLEIEDGELPEYLASKNIGWWTDTFFAVYKAWLKQTVDAIAEHGSSPDYLAQGIARCESFPNHKGYILDDAQNLSADEFEGVVAAIRQHSDKPIVATFRADQDITQYLPTFNDHPGVYIARQLFRHDAADEKIPANRTVIVAFWLREYLTHCCNLEYHRAGGVTTSADDLRAMYRHCIDAGKRWFMGYASVDTNGFRVWDHPELWQALKDIAQDFKTKYSSAG